MANAETIVGSMRSDLTTVFEALQTNLAQAVQDKEDFVAEEGADFFTDWFGEVVGYDITFDDMLAAITAAEAILATFEANRSKLQVVRTR
jgi:hypothetical protein